MLGLFRERSPFLIPVLFLIAFALKFVFISNPLPASWSGAGGILEPFLQNVLSKKLHPGFLSVFSILWFVICALLFNHLLSTKRMYQRSNYLVALSIILFTGLFPGVQKMQAGLVMLPFTLLLFHLMTQLYNTGHPRTMVVNMGLLAGTGAILYHPYCWMLPCCMWAMAHMRPFRLNEWALLFTGFLIPYYFIISIEFLTGNLHLQKHVPDWNIPDAWPAFNLWWAAAILLAIVWLTAGFSQWQTANRRMLIQIRKNWYILLMMGILMIPALFFPSGNLYEGLTQLALPAGALGAYAFTGDKSGFMKSFLYWLLVAASILFSWAMLHNKF